MCSSIPAYPVLPVWEPPHVPQNQLQRGVPAWADALAGRAGLRAAGIVLDPNHV